LGRRPTAAPRHHRGLRCKHRHCSVAYITLVPLRITIALSNQAKQLTTFPSAPHPACLVGLLPCPFPCRRARGVAMSAAAAEEMRCASELLICPPLTTRPRFPSNARPMCPQVSRFGRPAWLPPLHSPHEQRRLSLAGRTTNTARSNNKIAVSCCNPRLINLVSIVLVRAF
jgi:hypothetical protein